MVKIGFIVEGDCEKLLIASPMFQAFLRKHGFEIVANNAQDDEDLLIANAGGGTNLRLPHNMAEFIENLSDKGAEEIYVLTDLEDEISVENVYGKIALSSQIIQIFVAVKALEAWYLADAEAMQKWLECNDFCEKQPENTPNKPFEYMKQIANDYSAKRGTGNKIAFTKRMLAQYGFDIERAAQHENCPSVKELVAHFQKSSSCEESLSS